MTNAGDERLIARLAERGCDLTKRREVGIHFHAPSRSVAESLARELAAGGWESDVWNVQGDWRVSAVGLSMAVSAESIADLRRSSEDIADRWGATYSAWQATLDPGMDIDWPWAL